MAGIAFILSTLLLGTLLSKFTDASLPWLDSAATSLSFVAQWMIAKKKIENWLIWIVVNLMYIGIYAVKDLWLYCVLFFVYLLLAINGYLTWRKQLLSLNA
jgi:nicotinamide mononucleotide transporter